MQPRILFVCTANICRSPAAEILFRATAPATKVASAGTIDWFVGQGSPEPNIWAAERAGHDLAQHRAQHFGLHHFDEYDWIIGMAKEHCDHIEAVRPAGNKARVRLFSSFDRENLPRDFPDPMGKDDFAYQAMWAKLQEVMPTVVRAIIGS